MDIAGVFEILSQGKIISSNSKKHRDYARYLMDENVFDEMYTAVATLGYLLHGSEGYFYLSKKGQMNKDEIESYVNKHKDAILAISILRQLRPQIDRGNSIAYTDLIHEYKIQEKEDSAIKNRLNMLVSGKGNVDIKSAFDALFDQLKKFDLIEQSGEHDQDKYKVLDAINYYIKMIELAEPNTKDNA